MKKTRKYEDKSDLPLITMVSSPHFEDTILTRSMSTGISISVSVSYITSTDFVLLPLLLQFPSYISYAPPRERNGTVPILESSNVNSVTTAVSITYHYLQYKYPDHNHGHQMCNSLQNRPQNV